MKRHLNLMSSQAIFRETVRTRLRQWTWAGAIVTFAFVVLGLFMWWPVHLESQRCANLEAEYEPIRLMKSENKWLKNRIERLKEQEQFVLKLSESIPVTTLVGVIGRSIVEGRSQVFVDELEFEKAFDTAGNTHVSLSLQGIGSNRDAITELQDTIRANLPFAEVQLEEVRPTLGNQESLQNFTILCTFQKD